MNANSALRAAAGTVLGLTLLVATALPALGVTYYRWLDDRGNPVHSDRPPPSGVEYEVISTGSDFKRIVSAEEGAVPPETTPRVGNEFDATNEAEDQAPKKNPEICKRARENMEALENSAVVNMRNDQGEIVELSPEEVTMQKAKTSRIIDMYC